MPTAAHRIACYYVCRAVRGDAARLEGGSQDKCRGITGTGLRQSVHTWRHTDRAYVLIACVLVVTCVLVTAETSTGSLAPKALAELLAVPVVGFLFYRLSRIAQTVAGLALASLYGILILVPADYLPLHKEFAGLRVDPLLLFVLLGVVAPRARNAGRRLWPYAMAVAVVSLGVVTYLTDPSRTAGYYLLSYLMVGGLVFVAAWRGSRTRSDLLAVSRVLMWSGGAAAAVGVAEYLLKRNFLYGSYYPPASPLAGGSRYFPGTFGYRITTTIGHPLDVGAVLTVALIVTAGVYFSTPSARERRISVAIALITLLAIVTTKSRADLILAPCSVMFLAFLSRRRGPRRVQLRPILLVAVLAISVWLSRGIWEEHFNGSAAASSTQTRLSGLHYVEQVLPSSLPLGLGFGASQAKLGAAGVYGLGGASAEDGWLELLIDGGPLLVLAMFTIPVAAGFSAIRNATRDDPLRLCHGVAVLAITANAASFNGLVTARIMLFLLLAESGVAASAARRVSSATVPHIASPGAASNSPRAELLSQGRA